jgi:hypothetical protein
MRIRKYRIQSFVLFQIFVWVTAACTTSSVPPDQSLTVVTIPPLGIINREPDGLIGEKISIDELSLVVLGVEENKAIAEEGDGITVLLVDVEIESHIDQLDVNPLYARIQGSNGEIYYWTPGGDDTLIGATSAGRLAKGAKVQGSISYEISKDLDAYWLIYESPYFPGKRIIINLTQE